MYFYKEWLLQLCSPQIADKLLQGTRENICRHWFPSTTMWLSSFRSSLPGVGSRTNSHTHTHTHIPWIVHYFLRSGSRGCSLCPSPSFRCLHLINMDNLPPNKEIMTNAQCSCQMPFSLTRKWASLIISEISG